MIDELRQVRDLVLTLQVVEQRRLHVRQRQQAGVRIPPSLDDHLEQRLDVQRRPQPSAVGRHVNHSLQEKVKGLLFNENVFFF